jgi:hypothetical protein
MASIDKHISDLQRRLRRPVQPSEGYRQLRAVLDEVGVLKRSCNVHYRAGNRVEGENIPRRELGPGYTHDALWRLAVARCVEAGTVSFEMTEACIGVLRERWERAGKNPDGVVHSERHVS